jgi:hypothetical protein
LEIHVSFSHKFATTYFGYLKIVSNEEKKGKKERKEKGNKKRNQ